MKPAEDNPRRKFLRQLTQLLFVVGVVIVAIPFFTSNDPTRNIQTQDIYVADMKAGDTRTTRWYGKGVFILKRSPAMLESLRKPNEGLLDPWSIHSEQPDASKNAYRSVRPEFLVFYRGCEGSGFPVEYQKKAEYFLDSAPHGVLICTYGGSVYDLAGRVYKAMPEKKNLAVPVYSFPEEGVLRLGELP